MTRSRSVSVSRVSAARGASAKLFRLPTSKRSRRKSRGDLDELAALFDLGPFDRNQLNREQIDQLRNWVDEVGLPTVCKTLEVSDVVVLRVCAGFGHRLLPKCAAKIRKHFGISS